MFGKYEMKDFKSNEEFFSALCDLIERIEKQGNITAAQELRDGFSRLNGLTDGWAPFKEEELFLKTIIPGRKATEQGD